MGWENADVQKQHMLLVCWCWKIKVPKRHGPPNGPITRDIANVIWAKFRADPASKEVDVVKMKRFTKEEFLAYSQAN